MPHEPSFGGTDGPTPRQKPGTPSLLRELNDRAALELLLAEGPLTRAQLSERTGVSKVTVSQMLARLEDRGLVMISGEQASGRGPNAALYSVVRSSAYVAGLYVESDLVRAAIADVTGQRVADVSVDPNGADDPVGMVRAAIGRACESAGIGPENLASVVIGSPGVLDPRTGAPRLAVNLPTWHEGVPDALREVLHTPVLIENDVNLAAMAERADGVAAGLDDFAFVWLGTGLGLAAVMNGQVRRGVGGAAGEIGWMPVHGAPLPAGNEHPSKTGLQALVGGLAVQTLAAEYGFSGTTAADAVALAVADARGAGQSSPGAVFLDELAHRVSIGVAAVCVVLDPGLVVLGGTVGKAGGTELADRVSGEVPRLCLARPAVVPTSVPGEPVLLGAMQAALAQARSALLSSLGSVSD
jgi:predicted NBD/HSP70 family sugar kinase